MTVPEPDAVGTLLRQLLDTLESDVARLYPHLGLDAYRPRFTPILRALAANDAMSIRELATGVGVTHSAASQTVAQMTRSQLVEISTGADARERIVTIGPRAKNLMPAIEREWDAVKAGMDDINAQLPMPLSQLLVKTAQVLEHKSLYQRIIDSGLIAAGDTC